MNKPKFDPNAKFEAVPDVQSKPAFDPNAKFESVNESASSEKPGLLSSVGSAVMDYGVSPLLYAADTPGRILRTAVAAPGRIYQGKSNELLNGPSGEQVAELYGVPKEQEVSPIAVSRPEMALPEEMNPEPGNPKNMKVYPAKEAGMMLDMASGELGGAGLIKGGKSLANLAQETKTGMALSQSGGMLKDFRRLVGRNKADQVANAVLNETVDLPIEGGGSKTVGIYQTGDTVENIAKKAEAAKQQLGDRIGQVYKTVDDKLTDPNIINNLSSDKIKELNKLKRFEPATDIEELRSQIDAKYGKQLDGKKVMARVDGILDDIKTRSNSLDDVQAIKQELDSKINYGKATQELPEIQQAFSDMRNYIQNKTNKYVEGVADVLDLKDAKELKDLNKRFGNIAEIEKMSVDKVARNSANRAMSPSDYYTGGVGAGIGGAIGGIPGAIAGAGVGLINKIARTRGPGIAAKVAEGLQNGLLSPQMVESLAASAEIAAPIQGLRTQQDVRK